MFVPEEQTDNFFTYYYKKTQNEENGNGRSFFNKIKMFVVSRVATLFYYSMTKRLLALYDTVCKCHHVRLLPAKYFF